MTATNNSTAPSSTPQDAAGTENRSPSPAPAATPATTPAPAPAPTPAPATSTTGSDRQDTKQRRTSQSKSTSSTGSTETTTVKGKSINQRLQEMSLPTVGEIGLAILSLISVAVLIGVSIYNLSLYNTIISGYLPMPWAWLQRLVSWSLWALIQACELIAILIEFETAFMALIAVSTSVFPTLAISGTTDPTVSKIQRRFNSFPKRWLFLAGMLSCFVFALDTALVVGHFEPMTFSGFMPSIDGGAVFSVVLTVLLFQAAFMICLFSLNGLWFVGMGRNAIKEAK